VAGDTGRTPPFCAIRHSDSVLIVMLLPYP